MNLYPSIDVREGKVVRLLRGDYSVQTTYDDDPVAVARRFEAAGATWIHVVDLDAARDGGDANLSVIEAICANVSVRVQTGGGVRTLEDASDRYAAGAIRVVMGSAAVEHPEVVDELAALHPGRIAVGLDARGSDVAIHGWTDATGADLVTMACRFDRPGVGALVVTQIDVDGTLQGPDVSGLAALLDAVQVPVIASGGVGTLDHLRALDRRLEGVIVGRAIYEQRFTVEEAIATCSASA
ncbi:MAG TPA: 1-(5-phosphoribosyl)-5-[(5-phosphoribosylamino)methylideneamino]imidazole-4-carboxamide isomerase [Acidimicrobiia bacterium]|nr:1-(5-phosphoribosyl)-5-[(5-phosphoribosylamino)methylideneamino]imidazole-4-carboxamide isomerase [Acidimicrobiia bacterium]